MKRITLNKKEIAELKETLEHERDAFKGFAQNLTLEDEHGQALERHYTAHGLQIAIDRLYTALNK